MKQKDRNDRLLLVLLIVLACPAIFLLGLMLGSGTKFSELRNTDTLGLWLGAISTLAIAILTIILAKETWHLRLLQIQQTEEIRRQAIKPSLEFYLLPARAAFQFMNVHIENNGSGAARNIKFIISGDSAENVKEIERKLIDQLLSINFLGSGTASLGVGKERISYLFSFIELRGEFGDDALEVRISVSMTYEDIEGHRYSSESIVDLSEFKGMSEIGGGDPIYGISKEMEKIRKVLESYRSNLTTERINVNIFSSADRDEEVKRMRERIEERQSSKSE